MPACFNDPVFGQTLRCDPGGTDVGTIGATAACSAIFGGPFATPGTHNNSADLSAIIMGQSNTISIFSIQPANNGIYNLIANGESNTVAGCHATVVNGIDNNVCGFYNHIGNGTGNVVSIFATNPDVHTCYSYIGNGYVNHTCANFSTIVNGNNNVATTDYATVVNGINNNATGVLSFIGNGGDNNIANANFATGNYSFIGNGNQHHADASYSFIGGGACNNIPVNSDHSFIGGGVGNSIYGTRSVITGGLSNSIIASSSVSVISGGSANNIGGGVVGACPAIESFIGGGACNNIFTNAVDGSCGNAIVGGCRNTVQAGATFSLIGSGLANTAYGNQNSISGGFSNLVCGEFSFIGGGAANCIATTPAMACCVVGRNGILSGYCNEIVGQTLFASIGGGGENRINDACTSFIGGGDYNCIQPGGGPAIVCRSFIGGGVANCIFENTSAIVGGECNVINAGGICSFIGGGAHNTLSGNFSSILGGQNNNDGGFANAHIAGSGIALGLGVGNPNSLHINGLWANGIPLNPGAAPVAGTVFAWNLPVPPPFLAPTSAQLWIM